MRGSPIRLPGRDENPAVHQEPRPAHASGPVPPELVEKRRRRAVRGGRVPVEPYSAVPVAGGHDEAARGAVGAGDLRLRAGGAAAGFLLFLNPDE